LGFNRAFTVHDGPGYLTNTQFCVKLRLIMQSVESTLARIENVLDGAAQQSRNQLTQDCSTYLDLEREEGNSDPVQFERRCATAISLERLLITIPVLEAGGTQREADSLIEHLYATAACLYQQTENEKETDKFQRILQLIEENVTYSVEQASLPELLKTSIGNCEAITKYTLMVLRILFPSLLLRIQIIAPNGKRGYSGNEHMRVAWAVPDDPYSFWTADPLGSDPDGGLCHIERLSQAPLMDVPAEYLLLRNALKKAGHDVPEDPWANDRVDYEQQERPPSSGGLEIQGGVEPVDKDTTIPPEALKPPQKRGKKMLFSDHKMPTRARLMIRNAFNIAVFSLIVHGSIDAIKRHRNRGDGRNNPKRNNRS
jgi:hypothetical protein